jgi:hypothetical protein
VGSQIKTENKVEMFELTKSCGLDKKSCQFNLQSLPLLSKDTKKYFLSLVFLGLGERSICVKCVRVSKINCIRNRFADGSKKQQKSEIEALNNRYGLMLIVCLTGVPHHHKEDD